jgi:predicted ester cyclase
MAMKGFDPEFTDLTDYILKITARIWEGRGVGLIRRWYARDVVMHLSTGTARGVDGVVSGTLETLALIPERRLLGEDVIWSGDETRGFLSSHRIVSTGRHRGDSHFGPATGKRLAVRAIADCFVRRNQVVEEWLVRDQAAICRQIGVDIREIAARLAERDARNELAAPARKILARPRAHRPILLQNHDAARLHRETLHRVVNDTDLAAIRRHYAEAVNVHLPGHHTAYGHAELENFWIGLLASFPDARLVIDHSIARTDPGRPIRVATRWRLAATHSGRGTFGPPSGAPILVLGITHAHVVDGRIAEEWHLIDELAVWKQIRARLG